jgi:hypothetical protein
MTTFVAVVVAWVLFRAPDFPSALSILRGMLGLNGIAVPAAIGFYAPSLLEKLSQHGVEIVLGGGGQFLQMYSWIIVLATIAFLFPNTQEVMARYKPGIGAPSPSRSLYEWRLTPTNAAIAAVIAAAAFLSLNHVSEFLYYQF